MLNKTQKMLVTTNLRLL